MARGFRGMRNDFMEIINHIIGLCSVAHDDDDSLLPLPQLAAGDSSDLEASQVILTSNLRDSAATEDASRSTPSGTALVDDGSGVYPPQAELVVNDEDVDPSFAKLNNKFNENFWREHPTYLNIMLNKNDFAVIPSVQIVQEKCTRQNTLESILDSTTLEDAQVTNNEICFDSSSDLEDYCHYKEGEDVAIKKHFSSECILVEDHMPSIALSKGMQLRKSLYENMDDEEIRDFHQVDDWEYVVV